MNSTVSYSPSPAPEAAPASRPYPWAWPFLVVILLLQFFPIPKLPGINLAPENFVFAFALLACWPVLTRLGLRSGKVSVVAIAIVLFGFLDWIHDFLQADAIGNPARHIRETIVILLVAEVASHEKTRLRLMKLLIGIGVVQVAFGSLVYLFGEPFSTIRDWMLQSAVDEGARVIGERSRIAGTYGAPHILAYLFAALPMLALALYFIERRVLWLVALLVMLAGLFLNAERAAAGFLFLGMFYVLWRSGQRAKILSLLAVFAVMFVVLQLALDRFLQAAPGPMSAPTSFNEGTLTDRFGTSTVDELIGRLMYQVHGLASVVKHPLLGPTPAQYAAEVTGTSSMMLSDYVVSRVLAPHNHYINVGVRGGIPGWLLLAWALSALWAVHKTVRALARRAARLRMQHICVATGLGAAMGNAIFHNAGLFSPEIATSVMIGLLLGLYRDSIGTRPDRSRRAARDQVSAGDNAELALVDDEPEDWPHWRYGRAERGGLDPPGGFDGRRA